MARTIGTKYKKQVISLVKQAQKNGLENAAEIADYVIDQMPSEAFDTWESAHDEITRIAIDTVMSNG